MEGTPQPPGVPESAGLAASVRFAVYLTGGLVTLAFGISGLGSSLGEVLNCASRTIFCSGGFDQAVYYEVLPATFGAAVLIVISVVLFVLAGRQKPGR